MSAPDLKPRAIAVLVTLRGGALLTSTISRRIADSNEGLTSELLDEMKRLDLVHEHAARWNIAVDGIAWLQREGLSLR